MYIYIYIYIYIHIYIVIFACPAAGRPCPGLVRGKRDGAHMFVLV